MICPNCGRELKDSFKFCTGCGAKLDEYSDDYSNEYEEYYDGEADEVTSRSEPVQNFLDSFDYENEETMILGGQDDVEDDYDNFENEETVILQDFEKQTDIDEDEALHEVEGLKQRLEELLGHEHTTEIRLEDAPDYDFEGAVPVYKAPPSQYEQDTAYINHLRALKQLMDDGIITEDEFIRKKQQILGI